MTRYLKILTYYNNNSVSKVYKVVKVKNGNAHDIMERQYKSDTLLQIELLRYIGKHDNNELIINEYLESNKYDVNDTFYTVALWSDCDGEWYRTNL